MKITNIHVTSEVRIAKKKKFRDMQVNLFRDMKLTVVAAFGGRAGAGRGGDGA
jgi:hypothetical protein